MLQPLPARFVATREALHSVAEEVVAPARKPDNEISLRATPGGFGTPPFDHLGSSRQVRVEGDELAYTSGAETERVPLSSLATAAALVSELLGDTKLSDEPLEIDPASAAALGEWYGLADRVLERFRVEAGADDEPTSPRLWPEHFDLAIESGDDAAGRRSNYGFSPGDDEHPEPYVYVGPHRSDLEGPPWNAVSFNGAELGYSELLVADDSEEAALDFCRRCRQALDSIEEEK